MTPLEDCCASCWRCNRVVCLDLDEHLDDDGVCEGCGGVFAQVSEGADGVSQVGFCYPEGTTKTAPEHRANGVLPGASPIADRSE